MRARLFGADGCALLERSPSWVILLLTLLLCIPLKAQVNPAVSFAVDDPLIQSPPMLPIQNLLEQAQDLRLQQKWETLLQLLHPQESHHAGEPEFDFLLAQAASRAGSLTRAILAYERLQAIYPEDLVIQAEIATLYFRTGENQSAKVLFDTLLDNPLPKEVRVQVGHYLRAIRDRTQVAAPDWQLWTALAAGHDSNVNAGSDLNQVRIPGFPTLDLLPDDQLRRKSSGLRSAQIGLRWIHRIEAPTSRWNACRLMGEGTAQDLSYDQWPTYDSQALILEATLKCPTQDRRRSWQAGVQAQQDWRQEGAVRQSGSLNGIYFWDLPGTAQITLSAQTGRVHYMLDPLRKGVRHGASLGWMSRLGTFEQWLVGSSVGLSMEKPDSVQRRHQGAHALNVQVHMRYSLSQQMAVQLYASYEQRRYMADDVLFQTRRQDRQRQGVASLIWTPGDRFHSQWSFGLSRLQNTSSIDLHSYRRIAPTVTWRAAF